MRLFGRLLRQRHTAKRIFERLRVEYAFSGGYTIVKDYVRRQRLRSQEMFVPQSILLPNLKIVPALLAELESALIASETTLFGGWL
jgi:hypothetical protein